MTKKQLLHELKRMEEEQQREEDEEEEEEEDRRPAASQMTRTQRLRYYISDSVENAKEWWRIHSEKLLLPLIGGTWIVAFIFVAYGRLFLIVSIISMIAYKYFFEKVSNRVTVAAPDFENDEFAAYQIDSSHFYKEYDIVDASGEPADVAHRMRCKDGEVIWADRYDVDESEVEVNEITENIDFARNVKGTMRKLKVKAVNWMNRAVELEQQLETLVIEKARMLNENEEIIDVMRKEDSLEEQQRKMAERRVKHRLRTGERDEELGEKQVEQLITQAVQSPDESSDMKRSGRKKDANGN